MNTVFKFGAYVLAFAPNILLYHGATQRLEKPESKYLKELPNYLRSYEDVLAYYPYQVYIGNSTPEELKSVERPWYKNPHPSPKRFGKFGEIMPEDELLGLMKIVDVFDFVWLENTFSKKVKEKLMAHPILTRYKIPFERLDAGRELDEIKDALKKAASPLIIDQEIVGCVKAASDIDENQSAHLMLDLFATKATGVLVLAHLFDKTGLKPDDVDYLIECSEEIAGDMYNRGGGGIGKSMLEILDCKNATGYDLKSFCSASVFALVQGWSLVASGLYDNVVVASGGSVAKLGMNARDHVRKGMPVLEDVLGGFASLISKDDGINPLLIPMGKQDVAASYHVKDMVQSLVVDPIKKRGLRITDIDLFAPELQIPEILGRDVPEINYRIIAEVAFRLGEISEEEKEEFVRKRGVPGFAPQQGHIPSGVPLLGYAREKILSGEIKRAFAIAKGSLFLGRLTKLHDGMSVMIEKNPRRW